VYVSIWVGTGVDMRKILIDLGCSDGQSILDLLEKRGEHVKDYEIYGFDPVDYPKVFNFNYEKKAAGTEDGQYLFKLGVWKEGSSLCEQKVCLEGYEYIHVDVFNFSRYLMQFADDYVIVKCDIEGAEYDLFDKLFEDGTIDVIDEVYIELHSRKMQLQEEYQEREKELIKNLGSKMRYLHAN
jgi:FkbM family methyltransferase